MMASAGFPIREDIVFEVDEKLPFMGYTSERNGKTLIVLAGWSLTTDMAMGLVIHELSHVYRIETKHPSHNASIHEKVVRRVFSQHSFYAYQQDILHNIINNIQDLYADDISFPVYIKKKHADTANEFFLGWVHPPLKSITSRQDRWKSAELLLSAAFAQANLERHKTQDSGKKIEKAVYDFLRNTDKTQARKYAFFKEMMVNFPETVTDDEFEQLLESYLAEFLALTSATEFVL